MSSLRRFKRKVITIWHRIEFICENSSLHGFHYLVKKNQSWKYKSFWGMVIIVSLISMYAILVATLESFSDSSISFAMQTNYLGWNTTFPAVTVCEEFNSEKVWEISEKIYGKDRNKNIDDFIGDIAYFYGTCFSCKNSCTKDMECPNNFTFIAQKFRSKCNDLLDQCKWNNKIFDCCSFFLPIQTEFGLCYSINSKHTSEPTKERIDFVSNQKTGPGVLEITSKEDYQVFIHPSEDVPYVNGEFDMKISILLGTSASLMFSIIDVTNDPDVKLVPPEGRSCRFSFEKPENLMAYPVYSFSSCIVQCRIDAQIELCNCTHHLMPSYYENSFCDIKGLMCLSDHYDLLTSLRLVGTTTNRPGIECDCLPACNEPEYSLVDSYKHDIQKDKDLSKIRINLANLPSLRYNRQVVRTALDLVVAIGNAIGLFFGASILSLVEIFYFLTFRKWN